MDNLSKLGWLATEVLLEAGFERQKYPAEMVGVVLSNASSSLDTDLKYFESTKSLASPALFVYTLPNIVVGEICIRNNFRGENAFFISEHFDASLFYQYVDNLLNSRVLQACICGWVEVIEETYNAVLLLVEQQSAQSTFFNELNINKIYENGTTHGRSESPDH